MIPDTAERVERSTADEVNRQIRAAIEQSIRWHEANPDGIDHRLRELDREWDVERALEANAST